MLVCTSDLREKYRFENRAALIRRAVDIAGGRRLIFKLHPNENIRRAALEIRRLAPHALVYSSGSAEEMIANCDVFITRYSSTVYVALALGKEVHCDLDQEELRKLVPDQHGQAAERVDGEKPFRCGRCVKMRPSRVHRESPMGLLKHTGFQ